MAILSVDLANTSYANLGIVALEESGEEFIARRYSAVEFGLIGSPSPEELACGLAVACQCLDASVLLLDGPQGWKHPDSELEHSRVCERELNTPGKTGLPGNTKPANYLPFIAFSIAVFEELVSRGFRLLSSSTTGRVALESFPLSAWRTLGLKPLPAKAKTKPPELLRAKADLQRLFRVQVPGLLSHDETQALVAAFAGIAFARGRKAGYRISGSAPLLLEGTWREGYIINPTREAIAPSSYT